MPGRPKGAKNKLKLGDPGYRKPGRKPGKTSLRGQFTDEQILGYKAEILELFVAGKAKTLTDAAEILGLPPTRVHHWSSSDPDFAELVTCAREVIADRLEKELGEHANFIPKMMILKGYRPMFRERYRPEGTPEGLRILLEELAQARRGAALEAQKPADYTASSGYVDAPSVKVIEESKETVT
jgi:hypothetical protein